MLRRNRVTASVVKPSSSELLHCSAKSGPRKRLIEVSSVDGRLRLDLKPSVRFGVTSNCTQPSQF